MPGFLIEGHILHSRAKLQNIDSLGCIQELKPLLSCFLVERNDRPSCPLYCYVLLDCVREENQQTGRRKGKILNVI